MTKLNAIEHKLQELLALAHQLDSTTNGDIRVLRDCIHSFAPACSLLISRAKRRHDQPHLPFKQEEDGA